jgi:hypothetical protein
LQFCNLVFDFYQQNSYPVPSSLPSVVGQAGAPSTAAWQAQIRLLPEIYHSAIDGRWVDTVRLWLTCSFSEHVDDPVSQSLPTRWNEKIRHLVGK